MLVLKGHRNAVNTIQFSPDSRWLASAGHDARVRLWDLSTGEVQRVLEDQRRTVNPLAFAPDGQTLAAGGLGASVHIWETATGQVVARLWGVGEEERDLPIPSRYPAVCGICFSPNSRLL